MKMFPLRIVVVLALGLSLFLMGCDKKSTDANNDNNQTQEMNQSGQPMPTISTGEGFELGGILATISFQFQTIPGYPAVEFIMGYAYFGKGQDAGTVSVNGEQLSKQSAGGIVYYNSFSQTNPSSLKNTKFDGSMHQWDVSGSGDVPAVKIGVASPTAFTLTAPAAGDVDKSKGLTISWNGGGANSADSMLVMLVALDNSQKVYIKQGLPNNGNFTIPAADLSGFNGQAMLQVVKYRFSITTISGKQYTAVAEIVKQVQLNIQ